jgi:FkbM family methyltransferase
VRPTTRTRRVVRRLLNAVLPAHPLTVTVASGPARGLKIVIEPQREKSYWAGSHQRAVQQALVAMLEPGMTVWDIGAHAGFFTALCSRRVGAPGRVHAFEPRPQTRARLERLIELNRLGNVQVHACAVGAARAEGVLYDFGRSAQATLRPVKAKETSSTPIEVRTLPDLWDELGPPDVIKIDAEGLEVEIIESGADVLETATVSLVVELHNEASGEQIGRLVPEHRRSRIDDKHWVLRLGGPGPPSA